MIPREGGPAQMRILIINRFFWPDESSTAMLAADLAADLARAGHEVHVACARIGYDGRLMAGPATESWNGVVIHRLPSLRFGRGTRLGRAADLASFHLALWGLGPGLAHPDLVIAMTDPPLALGAAAWIARRHGAKLIQHTMDVYPEIAVELGALRPGGILARLLSAFDRRWLGRCDGVIVLGEQMAARLRIKGVAQDKQIIVPPWADGHALKPIPHEANPLRRELGFSPDDLVFMYSGNFGQAHEFDGLMRIMRLLSVDPRWKFVLAGAGARHAEVAANARSFLPADRLRVTGYQPRERLAEALSMADLHAITQSDRSLGLIVPSKLAGVLAVGRPVLFIGPAQAEVASAISQAQCGFAATPDVAAHGDTAHIESELIAFANRPDHRADMGRASRLLFETEFEKQIATNRIAGWLEALHSHSAPPEK